MLEIKVLTLNRQQNVVGFSQLIGHMMDVNSTFKVKYYIFQWKNNIQQKLICWAEYILNKTTLVMT